MRDLIAELLESLAAGRAVAYCRLVETRGSTPQKAGATMLIYADGSQSGTLGGGCVEAEVKRRALAALAGGQPEIARFQLDNDYGWDDGLICGGRMQVLVEPLTPGSDATYFHRLHAQRSTGAGCLEAIVFDGAASGLPPAACYLLDANGQLLAHAHDCLENGTLPAVVRNRAPKLEDRPRASAAHGLAFLPTLPRCRLLIVGGGHVGQAVGNLAIELDFDVWVVDDRADYVAETRFPRATRRIHGPIGDVLRELAIDANTYCLIVTRGHNHDEEALYHLADRGARYVGMIGSRRKIKLIFDDLLAAGISAEALARVYAPVGLEIGSQTVPEIAVSILAELVAHRNLNGEVPGRLPASVATSQP